uniref:Uncharacterized protein n=1 Tax=Trichuris muris TaxID=70415 RepID=A0A5S6QM35_TRIMR
MGRSLFCMTDWAGDSRLIGPGIDLIVDAAYPELQLVGSCLTVRCRNRRIGCVLLTNSDMAAPTRRAWDCVPIGIAKISSKWWRNCLKWNPFVPPQDFGFHLVETVFKRYGTLGHR